MTKEEYLLLCLAEECAEVSQRIIKALRFGLDEVQQSNPDEIRTNRQRISYEFNDLIAVSEMIDELHEHYAFGNFEQIAIKTAKLNKYMAYSKQQGTLQ
jgi:hypothetical protein